MGTAAGAKGGIFFGGIAMAAVFVLEMEWVDSLVNMLEPRKTILHTAGHIAIRVIPSP